MNMDCTRTGTNLKIMLDLLERNPYSGFLAISTMLLGMKLSLGHY